VPELLVCFARNGWSETFPDASWVQMELSRNSSRERHFGATLLSIFDNLLRCVDGSVTVYCYQKGICKNSLHAKLAVLRSLLQLHTC
jgi:hypothetical protein